MKKKKLPYAYLTFSFARHEIRDAKNIKTASPKQRCVYLVNFFISGLSDNNLNKKLAQFS